MEWFFAIEVKVLNVDGGFSIKSGVELKYGTCNFCYVELECGME